MTGDKNPHNTGGGKRDGVLLFLFFLSYIVLSFVWVRNSKINENHVHGRNKETEIKGGDMDKWKDESKGKWSLGTRKERRGHGMVRCVIENGGGAGRKGTREAEIKRGEDGSE